MRKDTIRKILCAASILAIAAFTAGCDDGDDNRRHAHRHNPPPPPPHHRPHHDDRAHRPAPPPRHDTRRPHRDPNHRPPHERRAFSDMEGEYKATALNNIVAAKGSSYYIDITEDNDALYLTLPNGAEYPITVQGEKMSVGGGEISKQASGNFVYKDKFGGMWLVEKAK